MSENDVTLRTSARVASGDLRQGRQKPRSRGRNLGLCLSALGGIRTPNLLIRSQMLYPLSYERWASQSLACTPHPGEIGAIRAQFSVGAVRNFASSCTRSARASDSAPPYR